MSMRREGPETAAYTYRD